MYLDNALQRELERPTAARCVLPTTRPRPDGDARGDGQPSSDWVREGKAWTVRSNKQAQADGMRHDRLMGKFRAAYLPPLALLTALLLAAVVVAVLDGSTASDVQLAVWAELCLAAALGALGGLLASAFRLRDVAELNPLRVIVAFLVMQPLIGAAFGLISWLILTSDMVVIASSNEDWRVRAVAAFAVGFSEPLFIGILGRAMGTTSTARQEGTSTPRAGPAAPGRVLVPPSGPGGPASSIPAPRPTNEPRATPETDTSPG
jgi:hypothetical protein